MSQDWPFSKKKEKREILKFLMPILKTDIDVQVNIAVKIKNLFKNFLILVCFSLHCLVRRTVLECGVILEIKS